MHFSVMIIGDNPEDQLEPFDENIRVPKYKVADVSEEDIKRFRDFYEEQNAENKTLSTEDLYKKHGEDWNGKYWKKDNKGNWGEYSTSSPHGKWDWYEIGGRWAGTIKLKSKTSEKYEAPSFSYGWSEDAKKEKPAKKFTDSARKRDIANLDELIPYALLYDDNWLEQDNSENEEEWKKQIKGLLADLPDDTLISFYDCHC